MSGPKVLRTITCEELVEIAVAQLAIIDVALRRWQAEISDTDDDATARRQRFQADRSTIEAAVATGRPDEIVRRANVLIESIDHDIDQMRDVNYVRGEKKDSATLAAIHVTVPPRTLSAHWD